jgi:hypothetical protein
VNTSTTRHSFALPALVLSILITSTMALIPAAAGIGTVHSARDAQTMQATATLSQSVRTAA